MGIQDCYEIQFGGFYEEISGKLIHSMPITNLNPEICKKYASLREILKKKQVWALKDHLVDHVAADQNRLFFIWSDWVVQGGLWISIKITKKKTLLDPNKTSC